MCPRFALVALSCFAFLQLTPVLRAAERPNFVFIIADDCTFRDIGCYGGQAHTPNIDRLATEGMKFERCFQAAPMCSPTRHNIYTGLYPVRSGAYPNHTFAKAGTKSIVHYLKPLGYRVALSGKTHISPKEVFPFEYHGGKNPDMEKVEQLFSECSGSETPFCLFACSNEPHSPWNKGDASQYPPEKVKLPPYFADTPVVRDEFSRYLAEITYYDGQVGQILSLLEKHQLSDNTLVMVVSEQGSGLPFAKWTCYGNGLQSAMIVRWPGKVKPGSISNALVEYVDVTPTFVSAAGGTPAKALEGKSLLPVLTGKAKEHKEYVYGIMTTRGIINGSRSFPIRSVRDSRYRLIWNLNHEAQFTNACTKGATFKSWVQAAEAGDTQAKKLVAKYYYRPEFELFDCDADPLEMTNLIEDARHADIRERLHEKLTAWMTDQGDKGLQTEIEAPLHQGRNRGKSREEALKEDAKEKAKPSGQRKKAKKNK